MIRRIHNYLGLLIAPSVLFFALTGALQIFSLHEAHGAYKPPVLLEKLGKLHKDQVLINSAEHTDPPKPLIMGPQAAPKHKDLRAKPKAMTLALKWFFEMVALGLTASTLLGILIGLKFSREPLLSWIILGMGLAVPLVLLIL